MKSPEEMAASMRNNFLDKTGKTLADWLLIVKQSGNEKHGQIIKMLKTEHSMTHGFANLVAHDFLNPEVKQDDDLVTSQYSGAKQPLKVIYDTILARLSSLDAIEIAPKKAYVSLRHNKQFALIQPSTKTRVDVGINLKGEAPTDRLEMSGSFNGMVSHRVRVTDVAQVDDQLINWLQQAFDRS